MGDYGARTTCANEQSALAARVAAVVAHRLDKAQSVKHVAMPGPIGVASNCIDGTQESCALRRGRAQPKRSKFMRHRDNDAVDVLCTQKPCMSRQQVLRCNMRWHHNRVVSALNKRLRHTCRRFDLRNRITHDDVKPDCAVELLEHPEDPTTCSAAASYASTDALH